MFLTWTVLADMMCDGLLICLKCIVVEESCEYECECFCICMKNWERRRVGFVVGKS